MACEEDLAEVMQNALEHSGDLSLLRVQLEEKLVMLTKPHLLSHGSCASAEVEVTKPTMPNEVVLANELIREYLVSTGCNKTATVLASESGLPAEAMSSVQLRNTLAQGKKLDKNRPLLGIMVDHFHKK